jgi:subtilase family serine protease
LEVRSLLSVSVPGFAVPEYEILTAGAGVAPLSTAGPSGYTPTQIRHAYGFDQITFKNGSSTVAGDGSGTTIAIVDAYDDPTIASDLQQFDKQFGLTAFGGAGQPTFTKVNQTGGSTMPVGDKGWAVEISLDVEWAHAVAPKANILLVEANSNSYTDLMTAVDYARHASGVVAVSMSWGGGDYAGETAYDSYFTTPSGHIGVTFLASSGDYGAPAGYPATSPNVVAVGGTTLTLDGQNGWSVESGWGGSGGGISGFESQPAYQKGVVTQSTTFRTTPDISYDSNPSTGFPVYDSYSNSASLPWEQVGGTSDAAPQWAALIAIADQGRVLAGKGSLDGATQTLPALYALPSADFHDITSGSSTGTPKYYAGLGYDLVTGRGTPIANLVVGGLVGTSATPAPTISTVVVAEATAQNGILESNEQGVITWGVTASNALTSVSLTIDNKGGSAVYGPYTSSNYYAGVFGPLTAGSHNYTIRATDSAGQTGTTSGTFVVAAPPSAISSVVVTEATPKNGGVLQSNEQGLITWAIAESNTIKTASLTVDNKSATAVFGPYGPYGGSSYQFAGLFGPATAGSHSFTIRVVDNKNISNVYNGTFAVVSGKIVFAGGAEVSSPTTADVAAMVAQIDRQFVAAQDAPGWAAVNRLPVQSAELFDGPLGESHASAADGAIPVQHVDLPTAMAHGLDPLLGEGHGDSNGSASSTVPLGWQSFLPMPGEDLSVAADQSIDSQAADQVFASTADGASAAVLAAA